MFVFVYYYQSAVANIAPCVLSGCFPKSLVGEMEGKDREREEN